MSDRQYPAIPEPTPELQALTRTARALKAVVEILAGVRGTGSARAITVQESEAAQILPLKVPGYERSSLPPAAEFKRGFVFVVDGFGDLRIAYSDGFAWRYLADGGIVADTGTRDGGGNFVNADLSAGN